MLETLLAKKEDGCSRILVFIDEIQWLDTPKSGFIRDPIRIRNFSKLQLSSEDYFNALY